MGLAWMSPALGRNVALDFAEFLFESIQTGLDRLLLCEEEKGTATVLTVKHAEAPLRTQRHACHN